jgi:hypothetical protein
MTTPCEERIPLRIRRPNFAIGRNARTRSIRQRADGDALARECSGAV